MSKNDIELKYNQRERKFNLKSKFDIETTNENLLKDILKFQNFVNGELAFQSLS